jgi:hypothetical protein
VRIVGAHPQCRRYNRAVDVAALASPDFAATAFALAVWLAVQGGLNAVAILDAKGNPLAVAGALNKDEARAIATHALRQARTTSLRDRMLRGELVAASLGENQAHIGIAARCVFFVVVSPRDPATISLDTVNELRSNIEAIVQHARFGVAKSHRPPTGSGGSSSGPAELPVVEVGVTVRRRNSN